MTIRSTDEHQDACRPEGAQAHADRLSREAELESILATVPDGIIVIDDKGVIRSFSGAAERLFGYTAAEVCGRNVSMLMPSPYREQHDGYIQRYLTTGERHIIGVGRIARAQRKNGTTFPIELAVGEAKREDGSVLFTGFARDLTERQEREQRLHELQSELVHVSRISELGQMVSALAHEVNQPLAAIANYLSAAEHLMQSGDYEKAKVISHKALEQASRATQLIRSLRTFAKKHAGEARVEHLPKVIEEALALSLVGLHGRAVDISTSLHPEAQSVVIDKVQIQQVLFNLIRNAAEAMADGAAKPRLQIETRRADERYVLVAVADTGPGLSEAVRAKLFQPFVTTKSGGMGVGLSICRSIIEAHGGQLSARGNPGGGTIFEFTLPVAPLTPEEN
jgi:two-component system sensor kinase FixL